MRSAARLNTGESTTRMLGNVLPLVPCSRRAKGPVGDTEPHAVRCSSSYERTRWVVQHPRCNANLHRPLPLVHTRMLARSRYPKYGRTARLPASNRAASPGHFAPPCPCGQKPSGERVSDRAKPSSCGSYNDPGGFSPPVFPRQASVARGGWKATNRKNMQDRYRGLSGAERQTPVPPERVGGGLAESGLWRSAMNELQKCVAENEDVCRHLVCPRHRRRLAYCPWERNGRAKLPEQDRREIPLDPKPPDA